MRPSEIVKTLNEQGHKIHPALVIQALRRPTKKRKAAKRGRKAVATKATQTTTQLDLANLKAAAAFVKSQGSVGAAIESIKSFQKIADLFK